MAMINIPSTNSDPQYRYKMPRIIAQKEGRRNGSKTSIANMSDVSRALRRPAQYITKWFGNELGSITEYSNVAGTGERAIVNGHHDAMELQGLLDKFIHKYVLCQKCHLPEIELAIENGFLAANCAACGWAGDLDNNHRLAKYIVANPPDASGLNVAGSEAAGSGGKKDRQARKAEKAEAARMAAKAHGDAGDVLRGSVDNPAKQTKANKEKTATKDKSDAKDKYTTCEKPKKKKKDTTHKKDKEGTERQRKKNLEREDNESGNDSEKKTEGLQYDDHEIQGVIEVLQRFYETNGRQPRKEPLFEEVRLQQLSKQFDHRTRLYIVLSTLCGTSMTAKSLGEVTQYVSEFISNAHMEGPAILWAFGAYLESNEDARKLFPLVLKLIYDEDWASEHEILRYYEEDGGVGDPAFEKAKIVAAPFLTWLKTSDDNSDESDSSSESGS